MGDWVGSRYTHQIRTVRIGLRYALVAVWPSFVVIGFLAMIAVAIRVIVRYIVGPQRATRQRPVDTPQSRKI